MTARKKSTARYGMGFLRPFAAVLVLTAFILTITFTVRGISQLQMNDILARTKPLLAKVNIKLEDSKVGKVAGSMVSRITNSDLGGGGSVERTESAVEVVEDKEKSESSEPKEVVSTKESQVEIAFLADSHSDYPNLEKALNIIESKDISTMFFLGDFTKLGLTEDLKTAKVIMDSYDIKYYALPGDHDLWKSVGPENYSDVFGKTDHIVKTSGLKFVFLDNSANYSTIPEATLTWFKNEVSDADFVVMSQPLYYPRLDRYMGRLNGEDVTQVLSQRNELLELIRDSSVRAIISADLHYSDSTQDPEKSSLKHILVGALTSERNLQSPRFSVFKHYQDSSYELEDVVLE